MKHEMTLPNFVQITHISRGKEVGDWVEVKARINPFHITSYVETMIPNYKDTEFGNVTAIFCAGQTYCVEMTIEEVDDMMDNIQRGFTLKEEE